MDFVDHFDEGFKPFLKEIQGLPECHRHTTGSLHARFRNRYRTIRSDCRSCPKDRRIAGAPLKITPQHLASLILRYAGGEDYVWKWYIAICRLGLPEHRFRRR